MDEQTIMYLGICSMVALIQLSLLNYFGSYALIVAVLTIVAVLVLLVINFADFLVFPIVTIVTGVSLMPASGYHIPKNQNCVIKYTNGLYYATGYLTANVYSYVFRAESVQEDEEQQLAGAPDKWEKIIMSIDFPFKYNLISMSKGVQEYRDELEGKRGYIEFQLSKEMSTASPSQLSIEDYQRKINILQTRIDRISSGERPVNSIMYIETTSVGVSEKEAVDLLQNQVSRLQTIFNSFDVSISRIVGRELYYMFKLNYTLYNPADMNKIFNQQST